MVVAPLARARYDRLFFTGMGLASALMVFVGFAPSYFFRDTSLPPLTLLYQLHGAVFMTWIFLFIAQTALVAGRRTDLHRRLGVAGVVVAVTVFLVGVIVSVETLQRDGGLPGMDSRTFFALPLSDVIVFAVLVGAAVMQRGRADMHKRLMLLGTISLLTAAVARFLVQVNVGGLIPLLLGTDAFVLAVAAYDFRTRGKLHPATLWGGGMVIFFKPAFVALGFTPVWLAFADALR